MIGPLFVLKTPPAPAAFNMAMDEALLLSVARLQGPVLRFYAWTEPAATFGYFQHYAQVQALTPLRPLIRRPTAGGIVPHDSDWTYSLAFPAGHPWHTLRAAESYRRVHEWILQAFAKLGVATALATCCLKSGPGQCFVGYEQYDLLWRNQKVAGAAQRRTRDGLLIQGSVQPPSTTAASSEGRVPRGPDFPRNDGDSQRLSLRATGFASTTPRSAWETAMREVAHAQFGFSCVEFRPDQHLVEQASRLERQKYGRDTYNRKR